MLKLSSRPRMFQIVIGWCDILGLIIYLIHRREMRRSGFEGDSIFQKAQDFSIIPQSFSWLEGAQMRTDRRRGRRDGRTGSRGEVNLDGKVEVVDVRTLKGGDLEIIFQLDGVDYSTVDTGGAMRDEAREDAENLGKLHFETPEEINTRTGYKLNLAIKTAISEGSLDYEKVVGDR